MSDFIPPEFVIEVLKRLSVDDLGRCLVVCKSWYSLITSPRFISLHTQNQSSPTNNTKNPLLLVRSCEYLHEGESYSIRSDNDTFEEYKSLNFPFKSRDAYFRVIGCSNGVVCLSDDLPSDRHTITLWNPSIKRSVTLPDLFWHGKLSHSVGFAFCASSNDFKVVKVSYLQLDSIYAHRVPPELKVYGLSKGCWTSVDPKGFPYVVHPRCPQAYLSGAVHWTGSSQACRNDGFFNMIVSFDMGTEELGVIQMPPPAAQDFWYYKPPFRVSVLGESLSLIHWVSSKDLGHVCNIWVMKEYGKPESWSKLFTIDLDGGLYDAFGFLRNGQVLVMEITNRWESFQMASYHPLSKQVKHLGISGVAEAFYVNNFVETLVLLDWRSQVRPSSTCATWVRSTQAQLEFK